MTSGSFETIDRIFQEARRLAPEARGAFLDSACGDNASLRKEIDALLTEHDEPDGGFMDEPALGTDFRVEGPESLTTPTPMPLA